MDFAALIEEYGYPIVYLGGVFEGETVALLAGLAAGAHHLSLPLVMLCSQLGVFTSDQFCFHAGRWFGPRLLRRWPQLARRIAPFTQLVETHRNKLTLTFQFFPGAGAAVPIALGMSSMSPWQYLWLDLLGSSLWSITLPLLGYVFGAAASSMLGELQGLVFAFVGVVVLVMFFIGKRKLDRALHLVPPPDPP